MEILKRGDKHIVSNVGVVTCGKCASVLRVERRDFVNRDTRDSEGLAECPVCKSYVGSKSVKWGGA